MGIPNGTADSRLRNGNAGGRCVRKGYPHIVRPGLAEVIRNRTGDLAVVALVLQHIKGGVLGGRSHAVFRNHDLVGRRGPGNGRIVGIVGVQAYIQIQFSVLVCAVGKQRHIILIEVAGLLAVQVNLYIINMRIFLQALVSGDQLFQLGVHFFLAGCVGVDQSLGLGNGILEGLPGGRVIVGFCQLQRLIGINLGLQGVIVGHHIYLALGGIAAVTGGHSHHAVATALKGNYAVLIHSGNLRVRGGPNHIRHRGLAHDAKAGGLHRCL